MSGQAPPGAEVVPVRDFRDDDLPRVLELLQGAFGRWPLGIEGAEPQAFFRWKHRESPFGHSIVLVAEADGALAGCIALMPWRLRFGGRIRQTMRGVDLAVDPAVQRRGVSMQLIAATRARYSEEIAMSWSNPNERSRTGVLKSGRRRVGGLPRFAGTGALTWESVKRLAVHGGAAAALVGRETDGAASVLGDDALLERALSSSATDGERISTARDPDFLRWRYGRLNVYRALCVKDRRGQVGVAIFRVQHQGRFSVAHIHELLIERDDARLTRTLVRDVRRASAADLVVCALTSWRTAALSGLVRAPGSAMIAANPLHDDLAPDPTLRRSWALSLGDLELI